MKIFLSWSGAQSQSHKLAEALDWWLPNVFQSVKTFISTTGIEVGDKWHGALSKVLEDYDFGIACLTSASRTAPWIMFESGAIAKKDKSRLIPILCDVNERELKDNHPLTLFNYVHLGEEGMRGVIGTINNHLAEHKLSDEKLKLTFDKWWPDFKTKMDEVLKSKDGPPKKKLDMEPAIEEILSLLRRLARQADNRVFYGRAVYPTRDFLRGSLGSYNLPENEKTGYIDLFAPHNQFVGDEEMHKLILALLSRSKKEEQKDKKDDKPEEVPPPSQKEKK